ncbi:MAG: LapA family protein, partial [Nostocaceae cyanobacterium]|nr:LapA family protein [Nostocaceae cyanobacterium]
AAVVFASQNAAPVAIHLLNWSYEASMALVVLSTFSLGVFMGFLLSLPRMVYRMTKISSLKRTVAEQERQLADLNQKLLAAASSIPSQPHYSDPQPYSSKTL